MKTEPTGENEGREERVCSTCSAVESNVIPKLVHTLTSGSFSASLGGTGYFPHYSNFYGACVTDSLSAEERVALTIPGGYEILDVFDLAVSTSKGDDFIPSNGITFTFEYTLPRGEYASFAVYGEDSGELLYFTEGDSLSILCEGNGRYVLVGEVILEDTSNETTSEHTNSSDTENIPVSGTDVTPKNHVLTVLIIVAIILIVIIAAFVYAYVFKQYY